MLRVFQALALGVGLLTAAPAFAAPPEPPPIEAYGRLPAMSHVVLSPSGDRLAFIAADAEGRKLFVRTVAGAPLAVMPLDASKVRDVYWAGERFVIFTASVTRRLDVDMPPIELKLAFVIDLTTHKTRPIFGRATRSWDVVYGQYGVAEVGGRWYAFFSTLEQTRMLKRGEMVAADLFPDLYSIDLESGDMELLNRGEQSTRDWLLDGARIVARENYTTKTGVWEVTAGATDRVLTSGAESFGQSGMIGLGRTRDTFLMTTWSETGRNGVKELSLASGALVEVVADLDLLAVTFDRTTRLMTGYTTAGDERRTVFFDAGRQAVIDKISRAFPGKRPWVVSMSADMTRVVVFTDGGDDSGTYWLVDLKTLKADPLGDAYPRVPPSRVGASRRFSYQASDGLTLDGVLTLPPGREAKGLPVMVLVHDGPAQRSELGFDWEAQAYAARGYAVFQPNFRGSMGYGKAFRDRGFGEWGRKMQTDVSDGLAALAAAGIVDPGRACIGGAGYGGYSALAGVTVQTGLYRCAVAVGAMSDLPEMLSTETFATGGRNAWTRYWRAFLGADRPGGMALLKDLSPAQLARRADAPVLLIHGKEDTVVQPEQSRAMERALKGAGKPVEVLWLDAEDHWLSAEDTRIAALRASVAFVMKHNPPG